MCSVYVAVMEGIESEYQVCCEMEPAWSKTQQQQLSSQIINDPRKSALLNSHNPKRYVLWL